MRTSIATQESGLQSGAVSAFGDIEAATLVGAAVAASTVGGAALVGTMLIPGQVVSGLAIGGALVGLGETKARTGSYLPFLKKDEVTTASAEVA